MSKPHTKPQAHILILGAGVIGLQTALRILESESDAQAFRSSNGNVGNEKVSVSVVAECLPGDEGEVERWDKYGDKHGDGGKERGKEKEKEKERWASPWAGAHWRTHALSSEKHLCAWDIQTYNYWLSLPDSERKSMGLGVYKSTHYWDAPAAEIENGAESLWWSKSVQDFQVIEKSDLPEGVCFGVSWTAFALDPGQYMAFLLRKVQDLGGRVIRARLPTTGNLPATLAAARHEAGLEEGDILAYVNATGGGARQIAGDKDVGVQRGQTVIVKGEASEIRTRVGAWKDRIATVIPRRGTGTSIVGVSKETGILDTKVNDEMTKNLLEAGKRLAPELLNEAGEFEVVSVQVGLRPMRKGGPRVDMEVLPSGATVVHEYGHGGAGYQNSIGSANEVLRLLQVLQQK